MGNFSISNLEDPVKIEIAHRSEQVQVNMCVNDQAEWSHCSVVLLHAVHLKNSYFIYLFYFILSIVFLFCFTFLNLFSFSFSFQLLFSFFLFFPFFLVLSLFLSFYFLNV